MAAAGSYDNAGGIMSDDWVAEMNMSAQGAYNSGASIIKASSMSKMQLANAAVSPASPVGSVGPAYSNMYGQGYGLAHTHAHPAGYGSQNSARYGHAGASKPPVQSQLAASYMNSNMSIMGGGGGSIASVNDVDTYRTTPSMAQSILHSPLGGGIGIGKPGQHSCSNALHFSCLSFHSSIRHIVELISPTPSALIFFV